MSHVCQKFTQRKGIATGDVCAFANSKCTKSVCPSIRWTVSGSLCARCVLSGGAICVVDKNYIVSVATERQNYDRPQCPPSECSVHIFVRTCKHPNDEHCHVAIGMRVDVCVGDGFFSVVRVLCATVSCATFAIKYVSRAQNCLHSKWVDYSHPCNMLMMVTQMVDRRSGHNIVCVFVFVCWQRKTNKQCENHAQFVMRIAPP